MVAKMIRQASFTSGQVDPFVWKRTDVESYLTCAQLLQNMEVGVTGLCKKRKGTQYLAPATDYYDSNSRMYEFVDKNQNYYLILSNATSDNPAFLTWNVFKINATTGAVTYYMPIYFTGTTDPMPYFSAQLPIIDYAQNNDSLVLVCPPIPSLSLASVRPGRIYISDYTTPANPVFSFEYLNISPLPAYDFNLINYNAFPVTFTSTATAFSMVITCTDGTFGTGASSPYLGGQILSSGSSADSPLGYGIITAVTQATPMAGKTTIAGTVYTRFAADADMPTVGAQYSIRQPAWSTTLGYPECVAFYQNRLWFGNTFTLPNTLFGSRINQPISFDVGTGRDTDAIIYNIGQSNSGDILWLNGGKQLEIYSENFEFAAPQDVNIGLTPSTFSIRQQSSYGSYTNCKPTTYINDSYYIAKNGNAIINFHFNGIGQTYTSSNVSLLAPSLIVTPQNRALLRGDDISQDNFIYFLNSDYSVTAFQFATEFKLAASTPVTFGSNVVVKDICNINNKVYFLKDYTTSDVQAIEVFQNDVKMDGFIYVNMASTGFITGLDQFNGYTVQVVYTGDDGSINDLGTHECTGGVIYADNPNEYTATIVDGVSNAQVGLLYEARLRPMYITPGSSKYISASGATYDFKNLNRIYVDYVESLNFYINDVLVNFQSFQDIQDQVGLMPKTDTAIVSIANGWDRFSTFDIVQNAPFDLKITGISYQIESHII